MKKPILIERKDDGEQFIHLGKSVYRWGIKNNSIHKIPLETFDTQFFSFFYK